MSPLYIKGLVVYVRQNTDNGLELFPCLSVSLSATGFYCNVFVVVAYIFNFPEAANDTGSEKVYFPEVRCQSPSMFYSWVQLHIIILSFFLPSAGNMLKCNSSPK